jgi:hypothetical protein
MNRNPQFSALPLIVQEYVEHIVHKMRYRRSVRQEVFDELTAHFFDAVRTARTRRFVNNGPNRCWPISATRLLAQLIRGRFAAAVVARPGAIVAGVAALICALFSTIWYSWASHRADRLSADAQRQGPSAGTEVDNAPAAMRRPSAWSSKPSEELDKLKERFAGVLTGPTGGSSVGHGKSARVGQLVRLTASRTVIERMRWPKTWKPDPAGVYCRI